MTGGVQHAFNQKWTLSADYTHEQGNHGYRGYSYHQRRQSFHSAHFRFRSQLRRRSSSVVPNLNLFKSDNRSSYNALMVHLQGNMSRRFSLIANYTLVEGPDLGMRAG